MEPRPATTILIIDDDPAYRKLATLLLEAAGHAVLVARNADEGLRLAREQVPDLVLMDMHLPGMDGLRAMRAFRDDARTQHLAVIAVTAAPVSSERERATARAAGFYDIVTKPINSAGFRTLVNDWRRGSSP